jgi:hypothetical protein
MLKRKRQGQTWSDVEDAILREGSAKRWSAERLALKLGRTKESVKRRADMLKMPLPGPQRLPRGEPANVALRENVGVADIPPREVE